MKISTAMAIGRKMIQPVAGYHLTEDAKMGCALGMVNVAVGHAAFHSFDMQERMRRMVATPCECMGPSMGGGCTINLDLCGPGTPLPLQQGIVHLFNFHVMTVRDWTMDRLIDWVDMVEPKLDFAPNVRPFENPFESMLGISDLVTDLVTKALPTPDVVPELELVPA
jgi:hypothetical protein